MKQLQILRNQVNWNPNHWSVWKEIELRWGLDDYEDVVKRKGHESTLKLEWDAKEYARKRQTEYPTIEECVHAILDDDLDELQEKRAEVKAKHPRPT